MDSPLRKQLGIRFITPIHTRENTEFGRGEQLDRKMYIAVLLIITKNWEGSMWPRLGVQSNRYG